MKKAEVQCSESLVKYIKATTWDGKSLKGMWSAGVKIDGVRVFKVNGQAYSRRGKKLLHVPNTLPDGEYECYLGSEFKETISRLKTHAGTDIEVNDFYSLDPIDERLVVGDCMNPVAEKINEYMNHVVAEGYEGLVLRKGDNWLKVKQVVTYDMKVVNWQEGTGKYVGLMGALICEGEGLKCKVGTGFTDADRKRFTKEFIYGKIVEVRAMSVTADKSLRHPAFLNLREDK